MGEGEGRRSSRPARVGRRPLRPEAAGGLLLFLLAVVLRLVFWQATADRGWPYTALYKGDAEVWLEYAAAVDDGRPFELGLPLRPPGMAYLVALLWDGGESGIALLRLTWCVFGAAAVLLIYLAVLRSFGFRLALATGLLASCSTGLMVLSSSLNNETPYLLLVAALLHQWERVRARPTVARLALWSTLHALACLLRVEHALLFALLSAVLAWSWARSGSPGPGWKLSAARLGVSLVFFGLVLAPWHVKAWSAVHRFNTELPDESRPDQAAYALVERHLPALTWEDGALREKERLPPFCRRAASAFVAATVAFRGRRVVTAGDFEVLDQAFGSRPRPLDAFPFVALYGGLNFFLANSEHASGGFTLAPLDQPPPLIGGPSAYPPPLVHGLPPRKLNFVYPPHLEAINDGYRMGWQWIRANPGRWGRLSVVKLRQLWAGATMGLTGYGFPLGTAGLRRKVDMVVADDGGGRPVWRGVLLGLCIAGLVVARREAAVVPWVLLLLHKVVVTVLFFGYARHGATVAPVVILLVCLALRTPLEKLVCRGVQPAAGRMLGVALAVAALLVAVEVGRWSSQPTVWIDGLEIGERAPLPEDEHLEHRVEVQ